ncbi:MAG: hypothetical protein QW741_00385 [Sulfolobales archaeon]
MEKNEKNGLALLLGFFCRSRFSYARATVVENINVSFIDESVANDLRCYEKVDLLEEVEVEVPDGGKYVIFSVCTIDRVIFNGYEISLPTVVHVARALRRSSQFEAYIGKDLINYWQLYVDPFGRIVRSRIARRVRLE